jgi:hypothetical protein
MSLIVDTVRTYLPPKRKQTPSGWISFNAPCCADKRQRGGLIFNQGTTVSYHCFNCQFKASWQPGRQLSQKFKKLLQLLNVPDDAISKCAIEALRLHELDDYTSVETALPTIPEKTLPMGSRLITEWLDEMPEALVPVLEYIAERNMYLDQYPLYWTDENGFDNRLIIPFYYQNAIVGYTARKIKEGNPKYISEQTPGYVFNLDRQTQDRQYVIVVEGPFDAISIDGVALLGAEIGSVQSRFINQLQREVILVPDRDSAGAKTVEQATELGWTVSMPEWPEGVKDVNDAVNKLGRLATLWLIINSRAQSELKIKLQAKTWFRTIE